MFHKILVAMDTSAIGKQVFDQALALAKATDACLMLLHVLSVEEEGSPNMPRFSSRGYYPGAHDETLEFDLKQWEVFKEQGLELLRSRQTDATAQGVSSEFTQIPGNPGRTICDLVRNWGADLIVMGRRGHSGLSELILGSVSNYVLHHAPCSVFVVQVSVDVSSEVSK